MILSCVSTENDPNFGYDRLSGSVSVTSSAINEVSNSSNVLVGTLKTTSNADDAPYKYTLGDCAYCSYFEIRDGDKLYLKDGKTIDYETITERTWDLKITSEGAFGDIYDVSFSIDIKNVNEPPVLQAISNLTVREGHAMTTVNATDVNSNKDIDIEGSTLDYTCYYDQNQDGVVGASGRECSSANLSGVTFDRSTGVLDWRPASNQSGAYEFKIIASDGELTDNKVFSVTVDDNIAPSNLTISQTSIYSTLPEGSMVATLSCTDPDDNNVCTYEERNNHSQYFDITNTNQVKLVGTVTPGNYPLSVVATDGNTRVTKNFTITVLPPPFSTHALYFENAGPHLKGDGSFFINNQQTGTICIWFRLASVLPMDNQQKALISFGSSSGANSAFFSFGVARRDSLSTETRLWFRAYSSSDSNMAFELMGSQPIVAGDWTHACVVSDYSVKNQMIFYRKGEVDNIAYNNPGNRSVWPYSMGMDNPQLVVGGHFYLNTITRLWKGGVDELAIFNSELSEQQVNELWGTGKPSDIANHSQYSNLSAWWRLGGANETNLEDVNVNFQDQRSNQIIVPTNFIGTEVQQTY